MTREETIVLMCTYRGGGQQPNIPDGEPDLGPNNDTTAEGLVCTNRAASLKPDSESIAGRQRIVQQETSPTLDHTMMNTTCLVARILILTG